MLNQIDYPSSLINHVNDSTVDTNIDRVDDNVIVREKPKVLVIPEIVISESRDESGSDFEGPLVVARERNNSVSDSNNENVSEGNSEEQVPQLSQLLGRFVFLQTPIHC